MVDTLMPRPPTPLPSPPPSERWTWLGPVLHRAYGVLNRWFMVPAHRLGLGAWLATPIGGYMLLLRVPGRRTGRVRDVPLSYVIAEGCVWVMAGFGARTQWYRNLLVTPEIDVWLPGRVVRCRASDATDPDVRTRIIPVLARGIGLPGLQLGANPWTSEDEKILAMTSWVPLVRLEPVAGPISGGPDDPGGHGWIWRQAIVLWLTARLAGAVNHRGGRAARARGR
jgi:hypothetical protein